MSAPDELESARDSTRDSPLSRGGEPPGGGGPNWAWVISSYFAEGFPYTIVNNLPDILFKALGASLESVGLTSLLHLPWNLKFLWGPWLDRYGTKRRWLLLTEVLLVLLLGATGLALWANASLTVIAVILLLTGIVSATHDIAIDGFYLESLSDAEQSEYVGYRAMAYRMASLLVRGGAVAAITVVGWSLGFGLLAAIMLLLLVAHSFLLPERQTERLPISSLFHQLLRPRTLLPLLGSLVLGALALRSTQVQSGWVQLKQTVARVPFLSRVSTSGYIGIGLLVFLLLALVATPVFRRRRTAQPVRVPAAGPTAKKSPDAEPSYAEAFTTFAAQPRAAAILGFVIFFRTGESFLSKMKWPFLEDQVHLSLAEYSVASGTIGVTASFAATMLGGWLIARHGLRRWIWPFVLMQNGLNLLYVGLASMAASGPVSVATVTAVIAFEHFGEGLGTAVFMVYLMRCCAKEHRAAHMALVTALMSISFTLAGTFSGFVAQALGFQNYFWFTFVATLPGMALILVIPHLDSARTVKAAGPAA